MNSDSKPDILTINSSGNNVGVLLNAGNGTFLPQTTYPIGISPQSVVAVDVNSDGRPDIVVANAGSNTVGILLHC